MFLVRLTGVLCILAGLSLIAVVVVFLYTRFHKSKKYD